MENPENLFNEYSSRIFNLAYRMTGNRHDADDITQETFIQAFKSIETFKGKSHIFTWIYQIAKNKCLRYLDNKSKTNFISFQELINTASSPPEAELSEKARMNYIEQVKDGCLSGLLRCLPFNQRLSFILNTLFDVPINQVAPVINKSENATRILVHRAKQNLKQFLCENCSLYDSGNQCCCENLINFSLKQGWISSDSSAFNSAEIEKEIKDIKHVIKLYKTLHDKHPSESLGLYLQKHIDRKDFVIFSEKKVK